MEGHILLGVDCDRKPSKDTYLPVCSCMTFLFKELYKVKALEIMATNIYDSFYYVDTNL